MPLRGNPVLQMVAAATLLWGLEGCAAAGRAGLHLHLDDLVAMPGEQATFSARVDQGKTLAFNKRIANMEVRFYVGNAEVGRTRTDSRGRAVLRARVPSGNSTNYRAAARVKGHDVSATAPLYRWSRDRTIIAVDVDGTISNTNYSDLFVSDYDKVSKPLTGSREALVVLAREYQILYISARPHWLTEKTRRWLDEHNFPKGPVAHADGFGACFHQGTAKREILKGLRARWPNLLIGIGDKGADERAFAPNGMLTLIVNPSPDRYSRSCVVLRQWPRVIEFFSTHQQALAQPMRLASLIEENPLEPARVFD